MMIMHPDSPPTAELSLPLSPCHLLIFETRLTPTPTSVVLALPLFLTGTCPPAPISTPASLPSGISQETLVLLFSRSVQSPPAHTYPVLAMEPPLTPAPRPSTARISHIHTGAPSFWYLSKYPSLPTIVSAYSPPAPPSNPGTKLHTLALRTGAPLPLALALAP